MNDLLARSFRANPAYELALFDRLPESARAALVALRDDAHFYGVLRPRSGAALPLKAVDRDMALLFFTMRDPGALPDYVIRSLGDEVQRAVARLVADSVLEVAEGDSFVSGAAADFVFTRQEQAPRGRLAELSLAALRYASALPIDDANVLAARMYAYNTVPITPRWRTQLASPKDVRRFLGGESSLQAWSGQPSRSYWQTWHRRGAAHEASTHKLYVSPRPDALPDAFPRIVDALTVSGATQFKTGTSAHGLLRPDKLVAYFPSFDRLGEAAAKLEESLRGIAPQGVPFTAGVGGDGLLSWGADPPRSKSGELTGSASWRYWLVHRLARGVVAGRAAQSSEPWRFAMERLALDGVDVERWVPSASIWKELA